MATSKKPLTRSEIPEEVRNQAKNLISEAFKLLGRKIDQLGKELEDFNNKREKIRREIDEGARRTSGRII